MKPVNFNVQIEGMEELQRLLDEHERLTEALVSNARQLDRCLVSINLRGTEQEQGH